MGGLGARVTIAAALAVLVVLAVGLGAGAVRLLPWVFAPEVPLEVALPFARALGAAATETALLVGTPIGVALGAASFVERGEARSLLSLGVAPRQLAGGAAPVLLAFVALVGLCSLGWGSNADVPGRFAVDLVAQGRASCARATAPKSAQVPLVGVTWLCFPGETPRVSGELPGLGGLAWFTATEFVPSDDLREVRLSNLRVFTKELDDRHRLELAVGSATIRGLPGWGRSAKLSVLARASLTALTAALLALGVVWTVLATHVTGRIHALTLAALPALAAFVLLGRLDAGSYSAAAYGLVPALALAALGLVARLPGRRLFRRWARS